MIRKLVVALIVLASAGISFGQAVGGNGVPGAPATAAAASALAGGTAGAVPYQSAPGVTAFLPANITPTAQVVVSQASISAPSPTTKYCSGQLTGTGQTYTNCYWNVSPAIGETIACAVSSVNSVSSYNLVDVTSNSYTSIGSITAFSNTTGYMQLWYTTAVASPTQEVAYMNSSATNPAVQCQTVTGITASSPTDGQCVGNAASGTITCGTAITTSQVEDYLFCGGLNGTGSTALSAGSGFTGGGTIGGDYLAQYKIQSSAGSVTPTMGWTGTGGAGMVCSAFKAAGTTGAPTLTNAPALSTASMNATLLRSNTSSNSDSVGVLTLSSGSQTYTFAGTYATAPVCTTQDRTTVTNASHASTSTTVLTVTGTGTDAVGYICMGLN